MRAQATAFAEHAPQARAGSDPEHVHQTRVATRRLRAALRVFKDVLPADATDLKDDVKWIAGHLGPVRDLDVQAQRLQSNALELGLSEAVVPYGEWLEHQRQQALADFEEAFHSERFVVLTEHLQRLSALSSDDLQHDAPLEDEAPGRLRRAYRQLRKQADKLTPSAAAADFHQARIRAKRLRYAAEFFEPAYGKPGRRLVKQTTDLQDLLGDHQDGIVSTQRIHQAIQTDGAAWPAETSLALGQVVQYECQRGAALRDDFKSLYRDVKDAWRRLTD